MKKYFEDPDTDVVFFGVEDVITASGGDGGPAIGEDETGWG